MPRLLDSLSRRACARFSRARRTPTALALACLLGSLACLLGMMGCGGGAAPPDAASRSAHSSDPTQPAAPEDGSAPEDGLAPSDAIDAAGRRAPKSLPDAGGAFAPPGAIASAAGDEPVKWVVPPVSAELNPAEREPAAAPAAAENPPMVAFSLEEPVATSRMMGQPRVMARALRAPAPKELAPSAESAPGAESVPLAEFAPIAEFAPNTESAPRATFAPAPAADAPSATAPLAVEANAADANAAEQGFSTVRVFYATDRQPLPARDLHWGRWLVLYWPTWLGVVACLAMFSAGQVASRQGSRVVWNFLGALAAAATLFAAHQNTLGWRREARALANSERRYGGQRNARGGVGVLEYGVAEVTIPDTHRAGELEAPSLFRFEFGERAERHVMLRGVALRGAEDFFEDLRGALAAAPRPRALVFIHGYNVSFEDAVRRAGQLARDLDYPGVPLCYSWPSHAGLANYTQDEANVRWTIPQLKAFLHRVATQTNAETVHVLAHSMGNRALTEALHEIALETNPAAPMFEQVVLAAPDIDADDFVNRLAESAHRLSGRVTLYTSSEDKALMLSRLVHGAPQAGFAGRKLAVPGVDIIDAAAVDASFLGHAYYGANETILRDLRALFNDSLGADRRTGLRQVVRPEQTTYWEFDLNSNPTATARLPVDSPARQ